MIDARVDSMPPGSVVCLVAPLAGGVEGGPGQAVVPFADCAVGIGRARLLFVPSSSCCSLRAPCFSARCLLLSR